MAQYRSLAYKTGRRWRWVADAIEECGVITGFETGAVSVQQFTDTVRSLFPHGCLSAQDVVVAWQSVLGFTVVEIVHAVRALAADGRLLLASNTNPLHWQSVTSHLLTARIEAPAVLSFEVGYAKPSPNFFSAIFDADQRVADQAIFIDDLEQNVTAARRCGIPGRMHTDPLETAKWLRKLLAAR
ncbi:hypothetical protein [Actinomadura sp. 7K507]|uniref:hypothetical protein n=1 Tax=Actinomadura sp. 7K507 TaxID=2530365 RepID=UPI00105200AA|nr:hypothetical protein [Actinomadura sp. 7K507]TDC97487.1 hypothetical protein E1285_03465 [Actinomadura sp. 7K507]